MPRVRIPPKAVQFFFEITGFFLCMNLPCIIFPVRTCTKHVSLEEGENGGECGELLVDFLRGGRTGGQVHGDPGGQTATDV